MIIPKLGRKRGERNLLLEILTQIDQQLGGKLCILGGIDGFKENGVQNNAQNDADVSPQQHRIAGSGPDGVYISLDPADGGGVADEGIGYLLALYQGGKLLAHMGRDHQNAGPGTAHRTKQMGIVAQRHSHLIGFQQFPLVVDQRLYLSIFHEDAFEEFYEGASKYTMDVSEFEDTSVRGTITLPEEGYIYLSIPYERGWSATIDGKEATIETAPEGFSMIKASAGTHEVHLTFRPYGLTVCIVGTLIAWIIFLFTILFERRHNKRMLLKAAEADTTLPPAHLRSHQQAEEPHCELPQACSSAPQAPQEGSLPGTACYTDTLSDRSGGQAPDSIADTSAASEMKTQG